ncbi:unnamed protein product (macronuclear) [Paramecium tetraurelia]|uniref:Uncharacterized protein n=1 Tax=Paramecium tetraurelia TaxID=5888 RepID=A0CAD6_PARTE|nr:uncharacterized protein GSPATT00036533001 [Paramecium tetraurelia]CAK67753.1 unnamed protein product [Paramecium tetraurelia]|eukprot:XP_001435150.1 hypothetical protein (macronuclear) [Paramecium tetraurelia strain d4-2]
MFEQDYYKRIINKQTPPNRGMINTAKPWFPELKHRLAVKDYDYKFFALPPNKMVSLMKKEKLSIPTDNQIREFLRNHSLKHLVHYNADDYKNVEDIQPFQCLSQKNINQNHRKFIKQPQQNIKGFFFDQKPKTAQQNLETQTSLQYSKIRELQSQNLQNRPKKEMPFQDICQEKSKLKFHELSVKSTPRLNPTISRCFPSVNKMKNYRKVNLLMRSLKKIKLLNLTIPQIMKQQIFQRTAFASQYSKEFIFAAKQNNINQIQNLLQTNPFLVFQYDFYNMTALHWACKNGHLEIVKILLQHHADFDALEVMNRTPLSIAIQENQQEIVKLLLTYGANPWSTILTDLKILLQRNPEMKKIVSEARKIQILNKWSRLPQSMFNISW